MPPVAPYRGRLAVGMTTQGLSSRGAEVMVNRVNSGLLVWTSLQSRGSGYNGCDNGEGLMTNQQMLTQLRGLPLEDPYKIAVTFLDELAVRGQLPLSEAARNLLDEGVRSVL